MWKAGKAGFYATEACESELLMHPSTGRNSRHFSTSEFFDRTGSIIGAIAGGGKGCRDRSRCRRGTRCRLRNNYQGRPGEDSERDVSAIFALDDLPEKWKQYTELNESYVKAGKFTPEEFAKHQVK